jgi:hypothetical protein
MFGVEPLLVAIFMIAGGAITLSVLAVAMFIRERIAYNYAPPKHKRRSTYLGR